MEEREYQRYTYTHPYDDAYEIVDKKIDTAMKPEDVAELLNKQTKHIKELEEEVKVGEFWHSAYQGKQLDYDMVYAELRKAMNENQQLTEEYG